VTRSRLPRGRAEDSPQSLIDLRFLVLLVVAGLIVWLAFVHPAAAAAVGLGLSTLYVLHRLVGR
jgi:hypothetical protein